MMHGNMQQPLAVRDSNMELLRITAMLLVLLVHADFKTLGFPSISDLQDAPFMTFSRIYIGAISSVCVNVFILISGWYGIKLKVKSLAKIIFQTWFFCILMYLCFGGGFSIGSILHECKDILLLRQYWFVRAYILLMLMAPAMNALVDHASKHDFKLLLIGWLIFQTLFSYIGNEIWYYDGYSPLPFFGLYLLARYMRLYYPHWTTLSRKWDISIFLFVSLLISIISIILLLLDWGGGRMYNYTSPLIIITSAYLLLFFSKLNIKSTFINWIAISCFAAYLLHMNPYFMDKWYVGVIAGWWQTESGGLFLLYVTIYILALFAVSVLIDKVQMGLFNFIYCRKR